MSHRRLANSLFLKVTLAFMLFLDTSNTILQCMTVYRMTVTHFGDMAYLAQGTVFFALQCALPSSTACVLPVPPYFSPAHEDRLADVVPTVTASSASSFSFGASGRSAATSQQRPSCASPRWEP